MTPIFLAVPLNPRVGASVDVDPASATYSLFGQRRAPPGRNSEWKATEQKQRVRANGCSVYLNVCGMQTYADVQAELQVGCKRMHRML